MQNVVFESSNITTILDNILFYNFIIDISTVNCFNMPYLLSILSMNPCFYAIYFFHFSALLILTLIQIKNKLLIVKLINYKISLE